MSVMYATLTPNTPSILSWTFTIVFSALKIIVIIRNDIDNNDMATEKSNEAAYIALPVLALTYLPEAPDK